jgi:CheY-like chemotaxis protein
MIPTARTILLVEDDENDVLFMKLAMKENDIVNPLQIAVDGRQAFEYLSGLNKYVNRAVYPLPYLVLLDLKLPYMRGLDVLKNMREDILLRQVIVIILTSSQADSDIKQAYILGANAYVVKPPNLDGLRTLAKAIKDFWLTFNIAAVD